MESRETSVSGGLASFQPDLNTRNAADRHLTSRVSVTEARTGSFAGERRAPGHCRRVTCTNDRQHGLTLAGLATTLTHAFSPPLVFRLKIIISAAAQSAAPRKAHLQVPAGGLEEEAGPLLVHISNSYELPHRLFLARHFDLLLTQLVRLHPGKQAAAGRFLPAFKKGAPNDADWWK